MASRHNTPPGIYLAIAIVLFVVVAAPAGMRALRLDAATVEVSDQIQPAMRRIDADWTAEFSTMFPDAARSYYSPGLRYYNTETVAGQADIAGSAGYYDIARGQIYINIDLAPSDWIMTLAHEFGHHVQTLEGAMARYDQAVRRAALDGDEEEARRLGVRLELQAECLAGVWAHIADARGGPYEALGRAPGDAVAREAALHFRSGHSETHGDGRQRAFWLTRGYESGDPAQCDTFSPAFESL